MVAARKVLRLRPDAAFWVPPMQLLVVAIQAVASHR